MDYFITDTAEEDLVDIWEYIASDNPDAADKLTDNFFDTFKKLAQNPKMGHKRSDITSKKVLFWSIKHYLIIYKETNSTDRILQPA